MGLSVFIKGYNGIDWGCRYSGVHTTRKYIIEAAIKYIQSQITKLNKNKEEPPTKKIKEEETEKDEKTEEQEEGKAESTDKKEDAEVGDDGDFDDDYERETTERYLKKALTQLKETITPVQNPHIGMPNFLELIWANWVVNLTFLKT